MGKNIFSILSVFQGFLVAYFSVKLRFKIFIYPGFNYFFLSERKVMGYLFDGKQTKCPKLLFFQTCGIVEKLILRTLSVFHQINTP